jgi:hypothetical protein
MVLARRAISAFAGFCREEYRHGNAILLFWLRMAGSADIDHIIVLYSRIGAWRSVVPRQDIQAKTDNRFLQEEISRAG